MARRTRRTSDNEPPGDPAPLDGPAADGEDDASTDGTGAGAVTVEAIAADLRQVVRDGGLDAAPPAALLALGCVEDCARVRGYGTDPDGRLLAWRDVLGDALDALGDGGPGPTATRHLFGAAVDTRGRSAAERRRVAADTLEQSIGNYRRSREPQLLHTLAVELFRIDTQTGPPSAPAAPAPAEPAIGLPAPGGHAPDDGAQAAVVAVSADSATPAPVADGRGGLGGDAGGRRWRARRALRVFRPRDTERSHPRERAVMAAGIAGWVWWRWGLDRALLFAVLPTLGLHTIGLITDMVRGQVAARFPRLVVTVLAAVVAVGHLAGASQDSNDERYCDLLLHPSAFRDEDGNCPETERSYTSVPDEQLSPYYTPTTYATAHDPVAPSCPPPDTSERRTNFTGPPPECIDPDAEAWSMTVETSHGTFWVDLYADQAPDAVNSLAFLAGWNYWDGAVITAPAIPIQEGQSLCEADGHDPDDCRRTLLDQYIGVRFNRAMPPFDPDSGDSGPGYTLPAEPPSSVYDTDSTEDAHYFVLPPADDAGNVDPSTWFVPYAPPLREQLNDLSHRYTAVGVLDDPDGVISNGTWDPDHGRVTSAPVVIDTVHVETPGQRQQREHAEDTASQLEDIENDIKALEQDIHDQQNPPLGQEPATEDDLADEYEELADLHDQRDSLTDNPED